MKSLLVAASACLMGGVAYSADLTIDRLESSPSLDGAAIQGMQVSPDGKRVTFLRGKDTDASQLDLWQFDISSGKAHLLVDSAELTGGAAEQLSEEEKARRERDRSITGKTGIVNYFWNADSTALAFPIGGDIYLKPLSGKAVRLTNTPDYETDIQFSPKGSYVSFIRGRDLYIVDVKTGKESKLTKGSSETIANGMAEFAAQEELDRFTGYWWSPDETRVAFEQFDEKNVPVKDRYEVRPDGSVIALKQRYPEAGSTNVQWRLGVVALDNKLKTVWPKIPAGVDGVRDDYLARLNWSADSQYFVFQQLNRAQTQNAYVFRTRDGVALENAGFTDESDIWINLTHGLSFLENGDIILTREGEDNFRHLYRMDPKGNITAQITSGNWVVDALQRIDEKTNTIYFTGFKDSPLEKHLYSIPLEGGVITRITQEEGIHTVALGDGFFVDKFSSPTQPPQITVKSLDSGAILTAILENKLDNTHPYYPYLEDAPTIEFGNLKAEDGTDLYYRLYKPAKMEAGRKYPAIMAPYGGPHGQRATKEWKVDFNDILARRGYIVMVLDNRGMWNRGRVFESALKNAMGSVEVTDQVYGVNHLKSLNYIDGNNIGIWGWSYGGYMTLAALFKEGDVFKSGIAVAPVTDWRLYDTAYTERYLGHPDAPGDVYEKASVFPYLDGFKGNLLLIHGMADDNVFFDHSVKLMSALQKAGKGFELMTYPGKKHGIKGREERIHLWNQALGFFDRTLKQ